MSTTATQEKKVPQDRKDGGGAGPAGKEKKPAAASKPSAPAKKAASKPSKGKAKQSQAKPKPKAAAASGSSSRLRPGALDGLVLAYMREHQSELPITAGKLATGIERSSGAVANCLERLTKSKEVRRVEDKPRKYDLPAGRG